MYHNCSQIWTSLTWWRSGVSVSAVENLVLLLPLGCQRLCFNIYCVCLTFCSVPDVLLLFLFFLCHHHFLIYASQHTSVLYSDELYGHWKLTFSKTRLHGYCKFLLCINLSEISESFFLFKSIVDIKNKTTEDLTAPFVFMVSTTKGLCPLIVVLHWQCQ